ncbi:MAG: hypothetical protein HUK13_05665 [Muribaculaceae bacterium]|nr:hypothetical protein [Muribaculaceae bacterium]
MIRKFFCALGVAAMLFTLSACRSSEDNKELEPKVAQVEQIADKMANGQASLDEMLGILQTLEELSKEESKLSSGQMERIEKAAKKIEEASK